MPPEIKRDHDWHHHYYKGQIGLLITMHDEVQQVAETLHRIKVRRHEDGSRIGGLGPVFVVRSGDGPLPEMPDKPDRFELLPDLGKDLNKRELPATAITRNYSRLFQMASECEDVDWWCAITGDTVLLHEYGVERAIADAAGKGCVLAACVAYGQEFHKAEWTLEDLEAGKGGGRKQKSGTTDFMPQLFMVAQEAVPAFCEIPVTNRWTSEQCLGDAFTAWAGTDWRKRRHLYAVQAASYADGVVHHARYG